MEHRWAVTTATGEFVYGGPKPYDCAEGLSLGQVRVVLDRAPDKRQDRYSGDPAEPIRAATHAEIADVDAATATVREQAAFDDLRIIKALALVVADLTGKTPAQMAALVKARYRALG